MRAVAVRPTAPVVISLEVVALAAFGLLPASRFEWWPATIVCAVVALPLLIVVYRRNFAGWVAARVRWLRTRRDLVPAGVAVDIPQGAVMCGVRVEPLEAVTMIRVDGRPYTPTFLRGSTVSHSVNVLPLKLLTGLLDQPGDLRLAGIDVVNAGHRVRAGTGYPPLYSTLLADRPAAGSRTTYLIVRVDIVESIAGLAYRRSIGAAAAAATERIVNTLNQEGIRASALNAADLDAALHQLGAGLAVAPPRPSVDADADGSGMSKDNLPGSDFFPNGTNASDADEPTRTKADVGWRVINTHPGFVTTYYFSADDINVPSLQQMWSLRSDHVVQTAMLRRHRQVAADGQGPVLFSALVRTTDPQVPQQPPTLFLNPLPGQQAAGVLRSAPVARPVLELPSRQLDDGDDLDIPIGATGILVGSALQDDTDAQPAIQRDDLVMLALTDPQRATRIVMDTSEFYARQLIIRAAAAGERIAIFSHDPRRWYNVEQPNIAVVERRRRSEFVPTIIVNDRPVNAPAAGLASTVITLGQRAKGGPAPDLHFVQTSRSAVRILGTPSPLEVGIVVFRQEQAWTG